MFWNQFKFLFAIQVNLLTISDHCEAVLETWCPNSAVVGIHKIIQVRIILKSQTQLGPSYILWAQLETEITHLELFWKIET